MTCKFAPSEQLFELAFGIALKAINDGEVEWL